MPGKNRKTKPETRSERKTASLVKESSSAELILARELGKLIGQHLAKQYARRGGSIDDEQRSDEPSRQFPSTPNRQT